MKPRLLVVDDDPVSRTAIQSMLNRHRFHCEAAEDGLTAMEAIRQHFPDLILCDVVMPRMDGLTLFAILQKAPETAGIPFILMTGCAEDLDSRRALDLGVDDFLTKPFTEDQLRAAVVARLRRARSRSLQSQQEERRRQELWQLRLLQSLSEGVILTDRKGQFLFANRAAERIFGHPESQLLGLSLLDLIPAPDRSTLVRLAATSAAQTGSPYEITIRRPNGDTRRLEVSSVEPLEQSDQSSFLSILRDVTEKRAAESLLHLRTAALEAAVNGIIITRADGVIIWANHAAARLTGYSLAELQGQSPRLLRSGRHPPEFYSQLWQTIRAGLPWRGELVNRRKDGSLYDEEMSITPVHDAQGNISHFVAVKSDITDRREAGQRLRDSEALYRSLVENLPESVVRTDRAGRFTFVNERFCERLGRTPESILGCAATDIFPEPLATRYAGVDHRVVASGEPASGIEEYQGPDGVLRHVEYAKLPIRNAHGEIQGVQGIFRDITERIQAEQERARLEIQLRQAHKLEAIGQLAAGIAHEINTPSQFLGDNLQFLRSAFADLQTALDCLRPLLVPSDASPPPASLLNAIVQALRRADLDYLTVEIPRAIDQSLEGIARITSIVRAMKEFSHPGNSEMSPTHLNDAIETTVTVSRNEWKYVANVRLDLAPDLPPVRCFPGELNQVFLNLIVNAAQAIGAHPHSDENTKGTITISTREIDGWAEVRVQDTGIGIPDTIRHRIFDPFFTTKPVGQGTGQGLAIAHAVVVEKHQGTLQVESQPGQGTTFIIRLPFNPATTPS